MLSMANEKYEYCFFCETVKEEQLTCPMLITRTDIKVGAGYESLLDILRQFLDIGELPNIQFLKINNIDINDEN